MHTSWFEMVLVKTHGMFGSCLGWKVPWPLFAARVVKFRFTSLYNKMAAARVVLIDVISCLIYQRYNNNMLYFPRFIYKNHSSK